MLKMWSRLLPAVLMIAGCAKEVPVTLLEQPGSVPGNFKLREEPLLPLEEVVSRPPAQRPLYGLYTWRDEYRWHRHSTRKIGIKSFRFGGPMDDATFALICKDGIEVMKTVQIREEGEGRKRSHYKSDRAFIAAYLKSIERLLGRYGPGGTYFKDYPDAPVNPIMFVEIWNEPNFQYMISDREPRAEVEAEREALYAKVLPAAYTFIKKQWPQVTVVGFGAGGAGAGDVRFIKHVHDKNPDVAKSYDVLSTHPYIDDCGPETWVNKNWPSGGYSTIGCLDEIRKVMKEHGAGHKPVWYTEVGWRISHADGGRFEDKPGQKGFVSRNLMGAYIVRQYLISLRNGIERVHPMYITDSDGFNGGFFERDSTWRPSAYATKVLIEMLPDPRLKSAVSDGKDGLFIYVIEPHGSAPPKSGAVAPEEVIVAWNVQGPKQIEIPVTWKKAAVSDMLGTRKTVKPVAGKVTVQAGPYPVYVSKDK